MPKAQRRKPARNTAKTPSRRKSLPHGSPFLSAAHGVEIGEPPVRTRAALPPFSTLPDLDQRLTAALDELRLLTKAVLSHDEGKDPEPELVLRLSSGIGNSRLAGMEAGRAGPIPFAYALKSTASDMPVLLPEPPQETLEVVRKWGRGRALRASFTGPGRSSRIAAGLSSLGFAGSPDEMEAAAIYRLHDVTGIRWPTKVVRNWLLRSSSHSREEAMILAHAFRLRAQDLSQEVKTNRLPVVEVSSAFDDFCRHVMAHGAIPLIAGKHRLVADPDGPIIDRLRISMILDTGKIDRKVDMPALMRRLSYAAGARYGHVETWNGEGGEIPRHVIETIAGVFGVEPCWLAGEAVTRHSALE